MIKKRIHLEAYKFKKSHKIDLAGSTNGPLGLGPVPRPPFAFSFIIEQPHLLGVRGCGLGTLGYKYVLMQPRVYLTVTIGTDKDALTYSIPL